MELRIFILNVYHICALILSTSQVNVDAAKILFIPTGNSSHFLQMHGLGRVLLERGHEVHVLLSDVETIPDRADSIGYKIVNHKGKSFMPSLEEQQSLINLAGPDLLKEIFGMKGPLQILKEKEVENCRGITGDKTLLDQFQKEKFDFAVIDYVNGCGFLLAYHLQIEYAGVSTLIDLRSPR